MLTFTVSRGQIPVAIVRNNYLNNWAFKEKIDCLKAVFCGESIRENHFSCLLDIVFLLISTCKDAWFFGGGCCSVTGLYDELCCMARSHQMNKLDSTSDLLWLYKYTFFRQKKKGILSQLREIINVCRDTVFSKWIVMLLHVIFFFFLSAKLWHLLYTQFTKLN